MREHERCATILCLAIKLGRPESDRALGDTLMVRGTWPMAKAFLNCGHPDLAFWAKQWVRSRGGFTYRTVGGLTVTAPKAMWGRF